MTAPARVVRLGWRSVEALARSVTTSLRFRFPRPLEGLLDPFRRTGVPGMEAYEDLFRYFVEGWLAYRRPSGALARYPGWGSWSGRRIDELEAFSRTVPLWGAWVRGGRSRILTGVGERREDLDLVTAFARGAAAGANPDHPDYWGDIRGKSDQRIVEAADVALALWLFGGEAWEALSRRERSRLMVWLGQVHRHPGLDGNWHLFFLLVDGVQRFFGHAGADADERKRRWKRLEAFHLGRGWFRDGPDGPVDYYNAWGFHYSLHWLRRIDPGGVPASLDGTLEAFVRGYRYLLGPEGYPVMGRSVPYRLAVAAPLVLAQHPPPGCAAAGGLAGAGALGDSGRSVISPGQARRALDATWQHFVRRGAVRGGTVTQGYYGPDARLLDNYSGPAGPLWSLRSLVAAFALAPRDLFWSTRPEPLPVEEGSFRMRLEEAGWTVGADGDTGIIEIVLEDSQGRRMEESGENAGSLEPYPILDRLGAAAHGRPLRPSNDEVKYGRRRYASAGPHFLLHGSPAPPLEGVATFLFPY